jgi:hypothetical protein
MAPGARRGQWFLGNDLWTGFFLRGGGFSHAPNMGSLFDPEIALAFLNSRAHSGTVHGLHDPQPHSGFTRGELSRGTMY